MFERLIGPRAHLITRRVARCAQQATSYTEQTPKKGSADARLTRSRVSGGGASPSCEMYYLSQRLRLLVGLLLAISPTVAHARTDDTFSLDQTDIEGEIEYGAEIGSDPFSLPTMHVRARNRSSRAQELEAVMRGSLETKERILIPPGEEREVTLALPAESGYHYFEVEMRSPASGQKWSTSRYLELRPFAFGRLGSIDFPLNAEEPWTDVGNLESVFRGRAGHLAGIRAIVVDIDSIPSEWAFRREVADWILQGGILLVAVDKEEPREIRELFPDAALATEPEIVNHGVSQRFMGMGAIYFVPESDFATMGANFVESFGRCQTCNFAQVTERARNGSFEPHLLGVTGGASGGLLLLLLVFALLVGPFGWRWLVQKRGQPFVYLVAVAGLSTVFCGVIIIADKVIHGIDTKGSLSSIRVIDQRHDREIAVEEAVVWAPSSFSDPVVAARQASLLVRTHEPGRGRHRGTRVVRGHEQILEDVLAVRTPTLVASRYVGRPRQRLEVVSTDKGLVVENHLGKRLTQLHVWFGGKQYGARELKPGQRVVLTLSDRQRAAPTYVPGLVVPALEPLLERLEAGKLGENRFLAVADGSMDAPPLMGEDFVDLGRGKHLVGGVL